MLLPEYLGDRLPLAGRGSGIFEITISREEPPVTRCCARRGCPTCWDRGGACRPLCPLERGTGAAARPLRGERLGLHRQVPLGRDLQPVPRECRLNGIRRWVTPGSGTQVEADFHRRLQDLARESRTRISADYLFMAEAFRIDPADPCPGASVSPYGRRRKAPAAWGQALCGRRQRLLQPGRHSRPDPRPPGPRRPHRQRDGHARRTGPGGPGLRPNRRCLLLVVSE